MNERGRAQLTEQTPASAENNPKPQGLPLHQPAPCVRCPKLQEKNAQKFLRDGNRNAMTSRCHERAGYCSNTKAHDRAKSLATEDS